VARRKSLHVLPDEILEANLEVNFQKSRLFGNNNSQKDGV
jgi:hypothetical protein